jgi:hypothetical protein
VARLREIVFDAAHPARLARFWAAAIDGYQVRSYDAAELARLAARGLTPETDPAVMVDGPGPMLCFQAERTPKTQRNRVHLDVQTEDRAAEVARLETLGAQVRDRHPGFTVMLDPEGNEFCVVDVR